MIAAPVLLCALCLNLAAQPEDDALAFERARARVIRTAVANIAPAIVTIETIGGAQPLGAAGPAGPREAAFRLADGPTTGLVLSADGLILTSSINFARDPSVITVSLADGRRLVAHRLGVDHIRRLALIRVEADDLPVPTWAPTDEIRIGQYALACGRALGGGGGSGKNTSVSLGIVSAIGRRNGNAVQTDAKVSPVNYGGPLIDIDGRVLGLLVPMAGSGGELAGAAWYDGGIGFAIHADKIDFVRDRLVAGETIEPGKIGILLEPDEPSLIPLLDKLLPAARGVRIKQVMDGSPAQRAKLRPGDKVLAIDGQPTGDLPELQRRLSDRAAGETITLTLKRRWRKLDVKITLVRASEIGKELTGDD